MTDYKSMPKQITKEMADAFWEEYSKDRADDLLMRCYKALYVTAPAPQPAPDVTILVETLESIAEYWNQDSNEGAMLDACEYARSAALAALAAYRK